MKRMHSLLAIVFAMMFSCTQTAYGTTMTQINIDSNTLVADEVMTYDTFSIKNVKVDVKRDKIPIRRLVQEVVTVTSDIETIVERENVADDKLMLTGVTRANLPDLRFDYFQTVSDQPFEAEKDASFEFELRNVGAADITSNIDIGVKINGILTGVVSIGSIEMGTSRIVEITLNSVREGTKTVELVADYYNHYAEQTKINNSIKESFTWKGIPDLVASKNDSYFRETENFLPNVWIPFTFEVKNIGTGTAKGTAQLAVEYDNYTIILGNVTDMPPHTVGILEAELMFAPPTVDIGKDINFIADRNETIIEKSEANNNIFTRYPFYRYLAVLEAMLSMQIHPNLRWARRDTTTSPFPNRAQIAINADQILNSWQLAYANAQSYERWNGVNSNYRVNAFEESYDQSSVDLTDAIYDEDWEDPDVFGKTHLFNSNYEEVADVLDDPYSNKNIVYALITLNPSQNANNDAARELFGTIIAHEIGHVLGLKDISTVGSTIMSYTYVRTRGVRFPQTIDKDAIQGMY